MVHHFEDFFDLYSVPAGECDPDYCSQNNACPVNRSDTEYGQVFLFCFHDFLAASLFFFFPCAVRNASRES